MGNRRSKYLRATLLLMTIFAWLWPDHHFIPSLRLPSNVSPKEGLISNHSAPNSTFLGWKGVLRSPVLLIIITQRLELPAFAFSFPLSSVSATGRHKVQQLLLNTGCMKYPMGRRNEKCLKNFRICKCKKFQETYKLSFKMH